MTSVTSWIDQAALTNTKTKSYRGPFNSYNNRSLKPNILMHKSKCSDCVSCSWYSPTDRKNVFCPNFQPKYPNANVFPFAIVIWSNLYHEPFFCHLHKLLRNRCLHVNGKQLQSLVAIETVIFFFFKFHR